MPAVAVRHERRRQEKKVVCVNNLNIGDREGTSNTTGNRRPSLLTLQSPHSQPDTPITSPPYAQNSLPDIYVCSKVSWPTSIWGQFLKKLVNIILWLMSKSMYYIQSVYMSFCLRHVKRLVSTMYMVSLQVLKFPNQQST